MRQPVNPEIFGPEEIATERASLEGEKPSTAVVKAAEAVLAAERIIRFRGRPMILTYRDDFAHFRPLRKELFDTIGYPILGGKTRGQMQDAYAYLSNAVEDLTEYQDYILFGLTEVDDEGQLRNRSKYGITTVWDMDDLTLASHVMPAQCVWRSPYAKVRVDDAKAVGVRDEAGKIKFIMQLAGGDEGLYDDIMQSLAPLIMKRKPEGVIWWVGDGANGKSTLMDAIYRIFPDQLSSITVKRLVDGRDTPSLNGTLANVVKESSEGRVEDTEIYKAIGTHENFRVHKFHSQDDIEIKGNLHHIFSANMIPTFNDKGYASRRRTFIVPFIQRFESDPLFEEKTFTPELFGALIMEMCSYANRIKRQGYRYKWSAKTLSAKENYDAEASNAEEYAKEIIQQGVVAFDGYSHVKLDYENWCADNGYRPLGITNLRRAIQMLGFERINTREGNSFKKVYRLPTVGASELQAMGMGRLGLYTVYGWVDEAKEIVEAAEAKTEEVKPKQESILKGKW